MSKKDEELMVLDNGYGDDDFNDEDYGDDDFNDEEAFEEVGYIDYDDNPKSTKSLVMSKAATYRKQGESPSEALLHAWAWTNGKGDVDNPISPSTFAKATFVAVLIALGIMYAKKKNILGNRNIYIAKNKIRGNILGKGNTKNLRMSRIMPNRSDYYGDTDSIRDSIPVSYSGQRSDRNAGTETIQFWDPHTSKEVSR